MIVAVGGQGNLLSARVLCEAALASGVDVRMSEIHGMAQRGGVVESAITFGKAASSLISDGEADILLGFEPLETLRAIGKCSKDSVVITNILPLPPFTAAVGKVAYPELDGLQKLIRSKVNKLVAFDAAELARQAGNVLAVNMVMVGALAATNLLPVSTDSIKDAISSKTKRNFVETNLKAFELGAQAVK